MRKLMEKAKLADGVLSGKINGKEIGALAQRKGTERAMRMMAMADGNVSPQERMAMRAYKAQTSQMVDVFRNN